MAKGTQHAAHSLIAAPIAGAALGYLVAPATGLGAAIGCVLGILVGSDLDQVDQVVIHTAERKFIKYIPVLGYLWLALWDPYARLIPHRHPLSHFPIVGTLGRVAWLRFVARVVGWDVLAIDARILLGVVAGLLISDTLHWFADGCPVGGNRCLITLKL